MWRVGRLRIAATLAAILISATAAQAQLTVSVTSSGTQTTSPGSSVTAGAFSVADTSTTTGITITSVQLSISNPSLFSSMTLTGTPPTGSSQTESVSLQNTSTVSFPGLAVGLGQAATFTLSAQITGTATPTPVAASDSIRFAAAEWPHCHGASIAFLTGLSLMTVAMLWLNGGFRRLRLIILTITLSLAASAGGCGDCSLYGCGSSGNGTGSSEQQVTAAGSSAGFSVTGVPADLGTITSQ